MKLIIMTLLITLLAACLDGSVDDSSPSADVSDQGDQDKKGNDGKGVTEPLPLMELGEGKFGHSKLG